MRGFMNWHGWSKNILVGIAQTVLIGKIFVLPFLLIDDVLRVFRWIASLFSSHAADTAQQAGISRLQFLNRAGLIIGSFTFGAFFYGILRGGYNYKTVRIKLPVKDLPDEFINTKIVQVSDFHIGSFADATPVQTIVDLINKENADIVFFTGDLVNSIATEVEPYIDILKRIQTKTKVYSILGNHDYGMYVQWDTEKDMHDNFRKLVHIQRNQLGWDLLMDENRILEKNGKKLAVIGVQYIGNFTHKPVGDLKKAYAGAEDADVQLLLSHDPKHWDQEVSVNPIYKNIHHTFAGHTHGFQFGVEVPSIGLKWSPAQYVFPHWAGLYRENDQHLYVNRGIGFIGYPGRVGIPPELTVFQLVKA